MTAENGNYINSGEEKIRILVVDDQRMIREGLKVLLDPEPDMEVVGTAADGQSALEQVAALQPDIVLIDMEMPGGIDGVTTTKRICQQFEDTKILVLSSYDNDDYITQSLDAGAKGYILKGTPAPELREAIRSIHRGYVHIGPGLFEKIAPKAAKTEAVGTLVKPEIQQIKGKLVAPKAVENGAAKSSLAVSPKGELVAPFEQTVILKQSPLWSRAIIWTIIGVTTFGVLWAAFAKIEQVVPAQGELKPQGKVKEIQAPVNGVVKEVMVEDGEQVEKDQVLAIMDSTASTAELASYKKIQKALRQQNEFYQTLMEKPLDESEVERAIARLNLPQKVAALARNRTVLVSENQLFRIQLAGGRQTAKLDADQLARLEANKAELDSRAATARLDMEQLEKQLSQNQVQLADARSQLIEDRRVLAEIRDRNTKTVAQAQESLEIEQRILGDVEPLLEQGAVAKLQLERQRQSIADRRGEIAKQRADGAIEDKKQQQQIQTRQAEINKLLEEEKRLRLAIIQAREKMTNTVALSTKELRDQIAENQQRIADIDSQLTKVLVDNDNRISELDSEISRAGVTLKYQEMRAPVAGTVFDLKASPGYVTPQSQSEPLLKIVPTDNLIAEVDVTNQDIGFVRKGMTADVRIDTFSFSEFGDIKGKVVSIGSDALPPDETHKFYRFPVKIKLDQQALNSKGRDPLELQSGMSVTANIRVRENRTVLSLFTELFTNKVETLKEVR